MTSSEVIAFYGSVKNANKAINFEYPSFAFHEHLRPMIQMRFYIASKGQLALDENLASLIAEVVKVMFWENEE